MGNPRLISQKSGQALIGIIRQKKAPLDDTLKELTVHWGPLSKLDDTFPFIHTNYYQKEMGNDLIKEFILIETPVLYENWAQLKKDCGRIETMSSIHNKRSINLDPTLVTPHNVILLSFKNYYHRIPISSSIFAELTLIYKDKEYAELPWTYPDFKTPAYRQILLSTRKKLLTHQ